MDPLRSWLDAGEVQRLAARLIESVSDPAAPATMGEAGFDEGFVGFTGEGSAPAAPGPAASPLERHEPGHPVSAPPSASGPFLEKIRCFRDWMGREFAAAGVFILDREGAVIFHDGLDERFHVLARSLALASRRPGASTGNVHLKIGARIILEVIPVETACGCLVLGAVVPASLPPESVRTVREALAASASPASR